MAWGITYFFHGPCWTSGETEALRRQGACPTALWRIRILSIPTIAYSFPWFLSLILKYISSKWKENVKGALRVAFRCRVKVSGAGGGIKADGTMYIGKKEDLFFFSGEAVGCWALGRRYVRSFQTLRMCSQAFSWFLFNPWLAAVKKLYYHSLFIFGRYYT